MSPRSFSYHLHPHRYQCTHWPPVIQGQNSESPNLSIRDARREEGITYSLSILLILRDTTSKHITQSRECRIIGIRISRQAFHGLEFGGLSFSNLVRTQSALIPISISSHRISLKIKINTHSSQPIRSLIPIRQFLVRLPLRDARINYIDKLALGIVEIALVYVSGVDHLLDDFEL